MQPEYDIFSGKDEQEGIWMESAVSFMRANERMKQIAVKKPGPYFVYCFTSHRIVARLDTVKKTA